MNPLDITVADKNPAIKLKKVPTRIQQPDPSQMLSSKHYIYCLNGSVKYQGHIRLCAEFPSLHWRDACPANALEEDQQNNVVAMKAQESTAK